MRYKFKNILCRLLLELTALIYKIAGKSFFVKTPAVIVYTIDAERKNHKCDIIFKKQ